MTFAPFVIVTATTEIIRDRSRVRVNEAYTDALASVGLIPVILPPIDPPLAIASLRDVAGLVLTGGEDVDPALFGQTPHPMTGAPHRARDAYEIALARAAYEQRVPTLAICRGAQVMNIALGGTLVQHIPEELPSDIDHDASGQRAERVHRVAVEPASRLARVLGDTRHPHQLVAPSVRGNRCRRPSRQRDKPGRYHRGNRSARSRMVDARRPVASRRADRDP